MISINKFEGSTSSYFEAGDIVFAKLKYGLDDDDDADDDNENYFSWCIAHIDLAHSGKKYDVTYQFNGQKSSGLMISDVLSVNNEQYWNTYFGASRQSGIIANLHNIAQMIFPNLLKCDRNINHTEAITTFARMFFRKLHSSKYIGTSCMFGVWL